MKVTTIFQLFFFCALVSSCVSGKKYKELVEREKVCSEELEKFKRSSLDFESKYKDFQVLYDVAAADLAKIKKDTSVLGEKYRQLFQSFKVLTAENDALEKSFDFYKSLNAKESTALQKQLEAKSIEIQRKTEELLALDAELKSKEKLLAEREQRVNELEEMLSRQEANLKALKDKVAAALSGFENKGLKVEQKNGKIYVSLEAKLLFKSGSIVVEAEGKKALIEIGKALELEKDLEIVVEGHTDSDKLSSAVIPRNNWELSVLRATAVTEIMLANCAMSPKQILAAGRGEFHPVDVNDKAKNRRIEIIISPNLDALFEIISQD